MIFIRVGSHSLPSDTSFVLKVVLLKESGMIMELLRSRHEVASFFLFGVKRAEFDGNYFAILFFSQRNSDGRNFRKQFLVFRKMSLSETCIDSQNDKTSGPLSKPSHECDVFVFESRLLTNNWHRKLGWFLAHSFREGCLVR